jgi:hypothetical protein
MIEFEEIPYPRIHKAKFTFFIGLAPRIAAK